MDFGTFLSSYRRTHELTLAELWHGVGQYVPPAERYSVMTVNRWEHNKLTPPVTWLHWLATHAPEDSWQREFAQRGMQVITDKDTDKGDME